MNSTHPELSVIMPALNEEQNILDTINNTLKAFEKFNINGEIIVINDGSSDGTEELVTRVISKNKNITMIKHLYPHGMGASFWEGVDAAKGKAVVTIPGDNENNPKEILRYFKLMDDVDLVVPFIFNKNLRSSIRRILSDIFLMIINTTFRLKLNYTNGTVIYRKSILKELSHRDKSFFFQTDTLIRAVKQKYLFAEVPAKLSPKPKEKGRSKALTFLSFLKVNKLMILFILFRMRLA